jgi:hypothetical protein
MNEVGEIYFRVYYDGRMEQLTVKKIEDGKPTFSLHRLTLITDHSYKFLDEPVGSCGTTSFDFKVIESKPKEFFGNLGKAKKTSLENFECVVNPNGKYKVARYFDDIFEATVTVAMSKQNAMAEAKKLNARLSCYVSYRILVVN